MDKPTTDSREGFGAFFKFLVAGEGKMRGVFSLLQCATSPLGATEYCTLDLIIMDNIFYKAVFPTHRFYPDDPF